MFEAVVSLCLAGAPGTCRDALLPGYAAPTRAACEARLGDAPAADGAARCVPEGPALDLEEIAPGVFVHFGAVAEPDAANGGDVANLGVVLGEASVAVIDTGSTAAIAEGLWRAIRRRTALPVGHVVLTHMPPDHVFGTSVFAAAGARIVGHARLDRALADRRATYAQSLAAEIGAAAVLGSGVGPVDVPVTDRAEIDLGGRTLVVEAWPEAHTGTDVTASLPEAGIVFAGDLVFAEHTPALDGSLLGWQRVLREIGAREIALLVPGHGRSVLDWPDGAAPLERYLATLARDTRAAIAGGLSLGDAVPGIAASEADAWALFDAHNARNATVAYTELEWE